MRRRQAEPGAQRLRRRRIWLRLFDAPVGMRLLRETGLHRRVPFVGWLYFFFTAHLTPRLAAIVLVGFAPTVLLLLVGLDTEVFAVGFASIALVAASLVAGFVLRPRLRIVCHCPPRVEAGSTMTLRYEVHNPRAWTARDVAVDTLIYPDPRHLRLFAARLDDLPPGARRACEGRLLARQRGTYLLPALRHDSAFPLGLWRWGRNQSEPRKIVVYPRYTRLVSLEMPLGPRNRLDATDSRRPVREALEFLGCREYRDGDVLRHVHPRSSARLGIPVVKEFQAEGRARTAVLVDTWRSPLAQLWRNRRGAPIEAALSLAAAVVDSLSRTDAVLELLVAGPGVYRFVSSGRVGYLEEALDILAAVEVSADDPLLQLAPLLLSEIRAIQSLCMILTRWDARRAALVEHATAWGLGLRVLLLTPDGRRPAGVPSDVCCQGIAAVLRGEVTAL